MTEEILIQMPGLPVAWARAGRNKGFTFTPAKQRHAMGDLKIAASQAMKGASPITTPLSVDFLFEYPFPKSMSPKKRANRENHWRASRPDADNLMKLCADGLNGIVWADDALIVKASVWKVYGDHPRTMIIARPAGAYG